MNNRIALIQKTHWSELETEVWKTMFPARTVVAPPGFLGPTGGLAGGVGVLFPHGIPFLEQQDMVPACAAAAIVQQGERRVRPVSIYLPPNRKEETLVDIAIAVEQWEPLDTYWGGDVNLQLQRPSDGEVEAAALLRD
eukprot:8359865-Pyramimonas_sp.AAC.1